MRLLPTRNTWSKWGIVKKRIDGNIETGANNARLLNDFSLA